MHPFVSPDSDSNGKRGKQVATWGLEELTVLLGCGWISDLRLHSKIKQCYLLTHYTIDLLPWVRTALARKGIRRVLVQKKVHLESCNYEVNGVVKYYNVERTQEPANLCCLPKQSALCAGSCGSCGIYVLSTEEENLPLKSPSTDFTFWLSCICCNWKNV